MGLNVETGKRKSINKIILMSLVLSLAVLLVSIWLSRHIQLEQLSDTQLQQEALQTSRDLIGFVDQRQTGEPSFDFHKWSDSVDRAAKYGQETQNMYYRDFAPKVALLKSEFAKRGLRDDELEAFYEHPTNYIGLRSIALKLSVLAQGLHPADE